MKKLISGMHFDVIIVGGAAIGSSVACHLAMDAAFKGRILVIEKDPTYQFSASALSAASIRQQFSSLVNIRISLHGIAFLRGIATSLAIGSEQPNVGLHEGGYLYLANQAGAANLQANHALQTQEGADILLMDRCALAKRFPWLSLEDVAYGSWGQSGEGWFDGWALLQAFKAKARALGVTYLKGDVTGYERQGSRITAIKLRDGTHISCQFAVNAAGSQGAYLAATAGVDIPVEARKRYVYSFMCKADIANCPLMVDMSGVYVRPEGHRTPEGQMFICGASPPASKDVAWDENDPSNGDVDWCFFEETVWPALAARVPAFEAIKPGRAWAGPYDMNLVDANAIIGPACGVPNLFLANGFSGHGLQQAPAVGRAIAELITHGQYVTLDLADLGHSRLVEGKTLIETNVI